MTWIAFLIIIAYYGAFLRFYSKTFARKSKLLAIGLTILNLAMIVCTYWLITKYNIMGMSLPLVIVIMFVGIMVTSSIGWLGAAYAAGGCVLTAYSVRGIITSLIVLVTGSSAVLDQVNLYYTITIIAFPVSLVVTQIFRRTVVPDEKLKVFITSGGYIKLVAIYIVIAAANLTFVNIGRILSPNQLWYAGITLGACILTLGMLVVSIYFAIKGAELNEYEVQNRLIKKQYEQQVRHYKLSRKQADNLSIFRHDYKSVISALRVLISAGELEKATKLIDNMDLSLNKNLVVCPKFCDDIVLDSMLHDLYTVCQENTIRMEFMGSAPRNTDLSVLDAVRTFANLSSNAVEACLKVEPNERWIKIESINDEGWAWLRVSNSYCGKSIVRNGKYISTKIDKSSHGLGLESVKAIVSSVGGFVEIREDQSKKVFEVTLHIPRNTSVQLGN